MSFPPGNDRGIPRGPSRALPPLDNAAGEDAAALNKQKSEKLRRSNLQVRARRLRLDLRHSTRGYALIDSAGKRVDDRSDMTLDDVEAKLRDA